MLRHLSEIAQEFRRASGRRQQPQKAARARRELSEAPTLLELAELADELLKLEVRSGCFGHIERLLDRLRKDIVANKVTYAPATDGEAVEGVWINLLRLGLFDELRQLIDQHKLPIQPEVKMYFDFCADEYIACWKRGEAYRAKRPDVDIFTMGCIVWGETYIGNFLRYNLRSMLSAGNLPALRAQGRIVFSIVTDAAGERQMRGDPIFGKVGHIADIEFIIIPDEMIRTLSNGHLVRNFYMLYGMLDHCSIFFAQGAGSHLFMIPVDAIVAEGSLNNMANYRHDGYDCCGAGNIVANTETFLPALDARYGGDAPISIPTEELATLAVQHAHHYFTSQIIAVENADFGKHPRELFWPTETGVEIHSVFIHPLFTSASGLANYKRRHYANIDYGMIPRMFVSSARIKIIEDPREAYVNNFTAAGRLYETTGRAFAAEDFRRSHNYSYPVQTSLFTRGQSLPCRLEGYTPYHNIADDVKEIAKLLRDDRLVSLEKASAAAAPTELTIILPTRNRAAFCKAQIRFLLSCGVRHRVVVADSSDRPDPSLKAACTGLIEYRQFAPSIPLGDKFVAVVRSIDTPYVAMVTDDDVSFLHTIDACLDYLQQHPDYVVAQGYIVDAGISESSVDIHRVRWFVQGNAEPTPLRRLYELIRRYQPFFWAVFRTPAYVRAIEISNTAEGYFFQELSFAATIAFLGNSVRLPMVQTLRSNDDSQVPAAEGHPFFWFLNDTQSFFAEYTKYRSRLLKLLQELETRSAETKSLWQRLLPAFGRQAGVPQSARVKRHTQAIDVIHASYFGREADLGMINHMARILVGDRLPSLEPPRLAIPDPTLASDDTVHRSARPGRRYVWRTAVAKPGLQAEFTIGLQEMTRVEAALDEYEPPPSTSSGLSLQTLRKSLIARPVTQWAGLENLVVRTGRGAMRLTEAPKSGYHRLFVRVEGGRAGQAATASFLAKPLDCLRIKIELHDDGTKQYVASTFDLETGEQWLSDGPLVQTGIKLAQDGYLHVSVGLVPTVDTDLYFTLTLLNDAQAATYTGRKGRGILLRELDIC